MKLLSINQVCKDKGFHDSWDEQRRCWVVDEDAVSSISLSLSLSFPHFYFYLSGVFSVGCVDSGGGGVEQEALNLRMLFLRFFDVCFFGDMLSVFLLLRSGFSLAEQPPVRVSSRHLFLDISAGLVVCA